MVLNRYRFFFLVAALFIAVNAVSSLLFSLFFSSIFVISLLESLVTGLSSLFAFIVVTRHYIPTAPPNFWAKFTLLALILFLIYASLGLAFGEPLLHAMGFELAPVPINSPLSLSEYGTLSFYTYGISSITDGLVTLAIAYFLQKYMVRGLFYGFKRITKYKNFFEADTDKGKSPIWVYVLWLVFLPFPLEQVLSPNTAGVSVLGTGSYLPSLLALFLLWGLGLAALVGIAGNKIFRLYLTVRETLLWFLIIQWLSLIFYSSIISSNQSNTFATPLLFLVRIVFAFGPPALITAYLYKRVLEKRAETAIVEYLREKEKLETARIEVKAEK